MCARLGGERKPDLNFLELLGTALHHIGDGQRQRAECVANREVVIDLRRIECWSVDDADRRRLRPRTHAGQRWGTQEAGPRECVQERVAAGHIFAEHVEAEAAIPVGKVGVAPGRMAEERWKLARTAARTRKKTRSVMSARILSKCIIR
eukprot:6165782-Pleurochrysis_carterae.AAC.2